MERKIVIPRWFKRECPILAGVCEMINIALADNPQISLAEFAQELSKANVEKSIERMESVEREQFKGERK